MQALADQSRRTVLEILRDAGYPVRDQDFIDLRKLPRK